MTDAAIVHILDDDPALQKSLCRLLSVAGHRTMAHGTAAQFYDRFDRDAAGCLVLDRNLPCADGHAVQGWLKRKRACLPVIFLTGEGDIASSVLALKDGAVDYLTKPISASALLGTVERALAIDRARRDAKAEADLFAARLATLTPREREVLDGTVAGRLNKQIAADLDIVEKTVKVHRARVMRKMGANTFAELVTMVVRHREDR